MNFAPISNPKYGPFNVVADVFSQSDILGERQRRIRGSHVKVGYAVTCKQLGGIDATGRQFLDKRPEEKGADGRSCALARGRLNAAVWGHGD